MKRAVLILAALPLVLAACQARTTTVTRVDRVVAAPVVTKSASGASSVAFADGCTVAVSAMGVVTTRSAGCTPEQMTQAAAVHSAR